MNMVAEYLDNHGRKMRRLINFLIKLFVTFPDSILPMQNPCKLFRRVGHFSTFVLRANASGSWLFDCPKNRGKQLKNKLPGKLLFQIQNQKQKH